MSKSAQVTMEEVYRISRKDYIKVLSDPILFIETFLKIDGQPAKLYEYQKKLLRDRSDNRVIEKARQLGISVICAYEAVYYCFTNSPMTCLFVSVTQNQSVELLRHSREAWQSMPNKIVIYDEDGHEEILDKGTARETQLTLELPSGSRIISLPNNPDSARGYRAHRVYWDEAAAFDNEYEMLRAIGITRVRGGALTYISTHHGTITEFYKTCEFARHPKSDKWNGFNLHTIDWTQCPDTKYQKYVLEQARQLGGTESVGFQEEFMCKPVDESVSFITKEMLDAAIEGFKGAYEGETTEHLKYWNVLAYTGKNPIYIGIDVGRNVDSTVMMVLEDTGQYAVVRYIEEISNQKLPEQTRKVINKLKASYFTVCRIDPIGLGRQMAESLEEEFGSKVELAEMQGIEKERMFTDLYSTIANLRVLLPPKETSIEAERLYNQLHSLKREYTEKAHQVRYVGSEGTHDDYVFALALAIQCLVQGQTRAGVMAIGQTSTEFMKQTREGITTEMIDHPKTEHDEINEKIATIVNRQYDEPKPSKRPCPNPSCVALGKKLNQIIYMDLVQNSTAKTKGQEFLCSTCWGTSIHALEE